MSAAHSRASRNPDEFLLSLYFRWVPLSRERADASSLDLNHLAWIQYSLRVEQALEALHQIERHRILHARQQIALHHADAVLGRNRAAVFLHHREDQCIHFVPALEECILVGADRLIDVVMDIAVAEMTEWQRP